MTWLLIAVALVACPTFIGLRLHAAWYPPPTSDYRKRFEAIARAAEEMARLIGERLTPSFKAFGEAFTRASTTTSGLTGER